MNAIAEAAKKRAAKLGIQNEEVDEATAGKKGSAADVGDLSHPFFSKLKQTGSAAQLSPRSKRLAEMNKENTGEGGGAVPAAQKVATAPPPPPPVVAAAPVAAAPAPQPPSAAAVKQVNLGAAWSDAASADLFKIVKVGQQQQHQDALTVIKRWAARYGNLDLIEHCNRLLLTLISNHAVKGRVRRSQRTGMYFRHCRILPWGLLQRSVPVLLK